jgi:hypothetical protein
MIIATLEMLLTAASRLDADIDRIFALMRNDLDWSVRMPNEAELAGFSVLKS